VRGCRWIAGYVPMAGEPGGPELLGALSDAVDTVLLPVLRPDRDLDWTRYVGRLAPGPIAGLAEPTGPRLGPAAVMGVDLVLVPAVAVDRVGVRLGRGGGSYDRALARVMPGTPIVAILYQAEVLASLPAEPHDRPVTAALTPAGLTRLGPPMV
jgi:5-formyltetrahydrofolate cyclo-ligase